MHPVVSAGAQWSDRIDEQRGMELLSATPSSNGIVGLYYEPRDGPPRG